MDYLVFIGFMEWGIGGGGFIIFILLIFLFGGWWCRKCKVKAIVFNLIISVFQFLLMGRDVYFKVYNYGQFVWLSMLFIKGKGYIQVKNNIVGYEIDIGDFYCILLEVIGQKKINKDFIVEFIYFDQFGNVYWQDFLIVK